MITMLDPCKDISSLFCAPGVPWGWSVARPDPPMTEVEIHRDSAPMRQRTFFFSTFHLSQPFLSTISQAFAAHSKSWMGEIQIGGDGVMK